MGFRLCHFLRYLFYFRVQLYVYGFQQTFTFSGILYQFIGELFRHFHIHGYDFKEIFQILWAYYSKISPNLWACFPLQKCSATPDLSVFLLMMSLRCSLSLSRSRLPVCPMYWQLSFPFCVHVLHVIQCKTCTQNGNDNCQYIGQTGRRLRDRLNEHRRDIINRKTDKSGVAEHFCKPGHSVNDLQILPLLQMHNERESVRRAKEQYFIGLANTLTPNGMNRTTDR